MIALNVHAVLTPSGTGGIAVLAATGPDVFGALTGLFRFGGGPHESRFRSGRLHYGHIVDDGETVDEVIIAAFEGSSSPTGQDYIEVNCHGGTVPVRAVSGLLVRNGVGEIAPEEFSALCAWPSRDRVQHQAAVLATRAVTKLTAQHLFAQASGALSGALRELLTLARDRRETAGAVQAQTDALLQTASFGIGLHQPRTVTVVGRPNVGKSTLANALIGSERSLVHPEAGTTRDAVNSLISLQGMPLRLADTAGLRPALDEIEAAGVRISERKLRSADLVVWVFDHSRPLDGLESSHLEMLAGKHVVSVVNKMDLPGGLPEVLLTGKLGSVPVHTCAITGKGIRDLKQRMLTELFGPELPAVGAPIVFTRIVRDVLLKVGRDVGRLDELKGLLEPSGMSANA